MSDFNCDVVVVDDVVKHPNADRLSIAKIRGFNCIVANLENGESSVKKGDWVVYIPEGALLPDYLLQELGFWENDKGTLAGSKGNRVKAIKLRDIVSQGILLPFAHTAPLLYKSETEYIKALPGDNVSEFLGITKYVPEIPVSMSGDVIAVGTQNTIKFDIENIQKYPNVFIEKEEVYITEKLHGTFCALAFNPELQHPDVIEGCFYAFSKGLGASGLVFKNTAKNNQSNIYQKTLNAELSNLKRLVNFGAVNESKQKVFVLGEIYGKGVQDLVYDGVESAKFRIFSIVTVDKTGEKVFSDFWSLWSSMFGVDGMFVAAVDGMFVAADCLEKTVPLLYKGPYSKDLIGRLRDGETILKTVGKQMREGIVITSATERKNDLIGRVCLKAVSPDYLLRKGNTTEFA